MESNDGEVYVSNIRMVSLGYTECRESEIHAWIEAFPEDRNDCASIKRWSASLKCRLGLFLYIDIRESCALFKVDQAGTGADVSGVVAPTPMQWASLQLLQRLALLKLARSSHGNHNFRPALREFIPVGVAYRIRRSLPRNKPQIGCEGPPVSRNHEPPGLFKARRTLGGP
jgi:hypothetical protein